MSAPPPALGPIEAWFPSNASNWEWAALSGRAPQLVATMRRYLLQLTTFMAPRSVEVADTTLRQLARWLTTETEVAVVNEITRGHVEDYKVWLAAQPGQKGQLLAKNTQRHRLRMIRIFLERLIEWDTGPTPRDGTRSCTATSRHAQSRSRGSSPTNKRPRSWPLPAPTPSLATGSSPRSWPAPACEPRELCELAADAVTRIGTEYWLRVRSASSATTA